MTLDVKEVKLEIYVPEEYIEKIRDALVMVGACRVGEYSHVVAWQNTKGFWKPLANSNPYNGEKGEICSGCEAKMEVRCPIDKVRDAVRVIKENHPYEEPVINVIPLLGGFI